VNVFTTLSKALKLFPEQEAVVDGNDRLNYRQVGGRVERLANGFRRLGLKSQDRISVVAPNCLAFLEIYYAAALCGLIMNPINIRLSGREMAYILSDAGSKLVLADIRFAGALLQAMDQVSGLNRLIWLGHGEHPATKWDVSGYEAFLTEQEATPGPPRLAGDDQPAHLYYTSGTTGRPKGVVLTHRNVTTHAMAAVAEFSLSDSDVWFHVAPMFHLADAWATFALTWVGGRHVMLPQFDAARVLALIEKEKITLTNLIPTMLNLMVNHPEAHEHDYASLRVILSGGAPIAPETVRRIVQTFGCDYIQTYGLTETSPYVTVSKLKSHLRACTADDRMSIISKTGREFLSVEVRVVDESGHDVPRDDSTVGEVWVRGDTVTPGYWGLPSATEEAFQDGWFKTGDLAVMDREGYIDIVDRKKDMIVTGGENVYSNEVEYVLYEHPAVLECAVVGVPDEKWGEAVKAVVVKKPGLEVTGEELMAFVKSRLAHYKSPKSVDFIDELPKTGSGKIMKRAVKSAYWKGRARLIQ